MPHKKNGVPRFFRETPFDLALFNYINLSAVVFSCKIFVKFCSLSKLQVLLFVVFFISQILMCLRVLTGKYTLKEIIIREVKE